MRIIYPGMLRRPALWNTNTLLKCRDISVLAVAMSSQTGYMRNLGRRGWSTRGTIDIFVKMDLTEISSLDT